MFTCRSERAPRTPGCFNPSVTTGSEGDETRAWESRRPGRPRDQPGGGETHLGAERKRPSERRVPQRRIRLFRKSDNPDFYVGVCRVFVQDAQNLAAAPSGRESARLPAPPRGWKAGSCSLGLPTAPPTLWLSKGRTSTGCYTRASIQSALFTASGQTKAPGDRRRTTHSLTTQG